MTRLADRKTVVQAETSARYQARPLIIRPFTSAAPS